MTTPSSVDPERFLHEQVAQASPDLLRVTLSTGINATVTSTPGAGRVCAAQTHRSGAHILIVEGLSHQQRAPSRRVTLDHEPVTHDAH